VAKTATKLVDDKPVTEDLGTRHFGGSLANFPFTDTKVYIAMTALLINIVIAVVLTVILRAAKAPEGTDATSPDDYYANPPSVEMPIPSR